MTMDGEDIDKTLFKGRFRLNARKFVFSNRVANIWNSLPEQLRTMY